MNRFLYGAGAILIVWGGYGLFTATRHPRLVPWLKYFVGAVAVHDLLIAPLVIVVGIVLARLVTARLRPYVISGLFVSGVVLLVGIPLVLGKGLRSDNPSIHPLDYTRGLVVTLAGVWIGVVVVALVRELRRSDTDIRSEKV